MPPIRAVGDEVTDVLTEAGQRWRAALDALAARRFTEAASNLERLLAIAADVPGPEGRSAADALAEANRGSAAATAALHNAESLPGQARELALLAAFDAAPDHPGLLAALHEIGVQPATDVRTRQAGGGVVVSWAPSASPGQIEYRVQRVAPDGRLLPVATTHRTELEVGLPRRRRSAAGVRRRRQAGRRVLQRGPVGRPGPPGPAPLRRSVSLRRTCARPTCRRRSAPWSSSRTASGCGWSTRHPPPAGSRSGGCPTAYGRRRPGPSCRIRPRAARWCPAWGPAWRWIAVRPLRPATSRSPSTGPPWREPPPGISNCHP